MSTDHREQLRHIRTFPQLVKYLRDELDWPIESHSFDDLTFDYEPEELGIDPKTAAKIEGIKQLRPLVTNQPWGIFFVKFEPKRLPVVALRRILGQCVFKKRASANRAERPAWNVHDLLFVSAYGEDDDRQISLAHFSEDPLMGNLATLKVLGWDGEDTGLYLDHVHQELHAKLRWPDDPADADKWRDTWSSAFTLRHREVITTSRDLALALADLARKIRKKVNAALGVETEHGKLRKLMKAFQESLIHDLDEDDFADMYAQTISYGLLSASISRTSGALVADDVALMASKTSPFLRELLETFLNLGGRKRKANGDALDFDELGINDVVEMLRAANMEAVLRDFGNRNPQEDPVIHFYELFLKEYDAKKRMQRGVFYTPKPVVSYIVRSVHELLQTEFGLADGLADTTTWGEMIQRFPPLPAGEGRGEGTPGLTLPTIKVEKPNSAYPVDEPIDSATPFVQILDPAVGTATFLVEVIDVIHRTLTAKWNRQGLNDARQRAAWNEYVPKHLLPRLHGYELLMAPYAIAHMKIGLKLAETGYRFGSDERARVYLTNALEPPPAQDRQLTFADWCPALAHEAQAVNAVKRHQRFTVVVGNPPYSLLSANLGPDQRKLVEPYKFIKNERIVERGALQLEKNLNDDYVKFFAHCEQTLRRVPMGILGLITNHSYLDNETLRGMRWSILETFQHLRFFDLHGSSKKTDLPADESQDENVFEIQQGVAIALLSRLQIGVVPKWVHQSDLWGVRDDKYRLLDECCCKDQDWIALTPSHDRYYFVVRDEELATEYKNGISVTEMFPHHSLGMITARDDFAISFEEAQILNKVQVFRDDPRPDADVCESLGIAAKKGWDVRRAREKLREVKSLGEYVAPILYRPFDIRYTFYHPSVVWSMARPVMRHMLAGENLGLCTNRQVNGEFKHAGVSRCIINDCTLSVATKERTYIFPLWLMRDEAASSLLAGSLRKLNLSRAFLGELATALSLEQSKDGGLPVGVSPDSVFGYLYSLLNCPSYRVRYSQFLKNDFPRLPLTGNLELFRVLARLGGELVALHLVEAPVQQALSARYDKAAKAWRYEVTSGQRLPVTLSFTGPEKPVVGKVGWSDDTVWIDAVKPKKGGADAKLTGTVGFRGVPEEVWSFHIGGYQVCQKWLKDRKGRTLSAEDITHYHRIVIALHETIRLMAEIDRVIDAHGGWPGAFATEPIPNSTSEGQNGLHSIRKAKGA